jgi:CHRD domain
MHSRLAVQVVLVASLIGALATAAAADGGRPLSATPLTGAAEVPGPGDPDASGTADVKLNQGRRRVCFTVTWANVDGTVFAGHIHRGTADVAGPILVTLFSGSFSGTDAASGCVDEVDATLIKEIRQQPTAFYVNVHSSPSFGAGALRGQLSK